MFFECDKSLNPFCIGNYSSYTNFKPSYVGTHCHAPACLSEELYNADTG